MKRFLLAATVMLCMTAVVAQSSLQGKVTDAANSHPLVGASVSYAGRVETTDRDGLFTITCVPGSRLTISFIGYEPYQQVIKNCAGQLNIALVPVSSRLNDVEITATSNQNKSILFQPASITKLNATELKRGTGLFLDDAINTSVPGVTMQRRTVSGGQQFNIRGYGNGVRGTNGPQSNFDGQGYKVYLNGIPLTDAEGITLMDDIDFGSIGNVEVVKGPAGTLYGLAIAGVVNLKTVRPPSGSTSIGQETVVGSYGLLRSTTAFQTGTDHSSLLVNYGYQESDGYMAHTRSTKRFMNLSGEFDISAKQTINIYAGHTRSYDARGGELTIAQYNSGDYSGNPAYIKNSAHTHVSSFRGGVGHTYRFNNHISNTTTVFGTGLASDVSSAGGWTDKNPVNYGLRSVVDMRFALGDAYTLSGITGVETQSQYAETLSYTMAANPDDPAGPNIITSTRSNQYTRTGTLNYFTEWTLSMPHDLSFTAGLGNSTMRIELNDRVYAANKPSHFEKKYQDMLAPHVAVNKVFNKALSLYASYSKGFKAPVSAYFFIPYATGVNNTGIVNTGLKPEEGTQYELGTKGAVLKEKLNYQLAVFKTKFQNKMAAVAVPNATNTATLYSYIVNSGGQDNKGLEAAVRYTAYEKESGFFRMIRPFANLTYSDFTYDKYKFQFSGTQAPVDYDGNPVAGVAKWMANLGLDWTMAYGLYANAVFNYKDPVNITLDGANRASAYHLINARLGIRQNIAAHFDLDAYVGGTNLTGEKYYYMIFVNQLPDAYLPAPKNSLFFGGLNLKYNF
jgi:iron complex outermembrane receptor protein